jgi:hypothetical protein
LGNVHRGLDAAFPAAKETSKDGVILQFCLVVVEVLFDTGLEVVLGARRVEVEGRGDLL